MENNMKILRFGINTLLMSMVLVAWTFQADGTEEKQRPVPLERKKAVVEEKVPLKRTERIIKAKVESVLNQCNAQLCTPASCGKVSGFLMNCYGCTDINRVDWASHNPGLTLPDCQRIFCQNNPGFCNKDKKSPLEGLTLTDTFATTPDDRPLYICTIPLVPPVPGINIRTFNVNALNSTDFQFLSQTDERLKGTLENLIDGFILLENPNVNGGEQERTKWIQEFDNKNRTQIGLILQKVSSREKLTPDEIWECAKLVEFIRSMLYTKLGINTIVKQTQHGAKTMSKTISNIGCKESEAL